MNPGFIYVIYFLLSSHLSCWLLCWCSGRRAIILLTVPTFLRCVLSCSLCCNAKLKIASAESFALHVLCRPPPGSIKAVRNVYEFHFPFQSKALAGDDGGAEV